jgi:dienelactone hydrolase
MLSRREVLTAACGAALASADSGSRLAAAEAPGRTPLAPLNRFPRMVQEFFVAQVRAAERAGNQARAALKTRADAEGYVADVRKKIAACFGPFPPKTPLNPKVTGKVERDSYTIEKLIFESRPGFLVTANLYLPKGKAFPVPGVVGSCGHSVNGKGEAAYQSFAQGLARMGYAVLIFDPIGQGERLQYGHLKGKGGPGVGVGEHLLAGNQQFLVGEFFGSWRAWDGLRALDYLLTRPEVDPKQVGVTGNSGGGTMTTWLCGVDQRWAMAAPGCFVTTFRRNLENELPADTEQCPPRVLSLGLDHADFLAALAPKPVIILAKERDYFDARGAEEAYARLKHLYRLLGAEQNVKLFIGPSPHGYTKENREAMYQWFNHVTRVSDAASEPSLTIETDETLWCTPKGQVAEMGSRSVFSFTAARAKELAPQQAKVDPLPRVIARTLKLPPVGRDEPGRPLASVLPPEYRIL